jgi:WD40 repeat protein
LSLPGISKVGHPDFLSNDGRYLGLIGGVPGNVQDISLWDIDTGLETFHWKDPKAFQAGFSPDASRLMVLDDKQVRVCNTSTSEVQVLPAPDFIPFRAGEMWSFSGNGQILAVGGRCGDQDAYQVRIWDLNRMQEVARVPRDPKPQPTQGRVLGGHQSLVGGRSDTMSITPDGSGLVLADSAWNVQFFDWAAVKTDLEMDSFITSYFRLHDFAFSSDGQRCAMAYPESQAGNQILVAELVGAQAQHAWNLSGDVGGIAFSPDGKLLAVSCYDSNLGLRSLAERISPKFAERFLAPDERVLVLDAQTGRRLAALPALFPLAFRPDGKTLVTYSFEKDVVLLWDMPPPSGVWLDVLLPGVAVVLTGIWWRKRRRE